MISQRNACIVIPIYKDLAAWEQKALANNLQILSNHQAAFIYPEGYDISRLQGEYPHVDLLGVTDEWLGKKHGIDGYNRMMLSEKFYGLFASYRYILICHTDAWIFRDEVAEWCARDYDVVAAPWPTRPIYRYLPFWLLKPFASKKNSRAPFRRRDLCGHVGNGGLSLRKVEAFRKAVSITGRRLLITMANAMSTKTCFGPWCPSFLVPKKRRLCALRSTTSRRTCSSATENGCLWAATVSSIPAA